MARGLKSTASMVVVHRLSCSATCGIFLDLGSNLCPLHWRVDSYPLYDQGSPAYFLNLTSLSLIRVVVCVRISRLFKFGYYSPVCIHHVLFTLSSSMDAQVVSTFWLLRIKVLCTHIRWNLCFHFFQVNTRKWNA